MKEPTLESKKHKYNDSDADVKVQQQQQQLKPYNSRTTNHVYTSLHLFKTSWLILIVVCPV